MKFIKIGNKATIKLSDGVVIMLTEFSDEDLEFMRRVEDEQDVKDRFVDVLKEFNEVKEKVLTNESKVQYSNWMTYKDGKFVIESISEVSLPDYLVDKLLDAERDNNDNLIITYLNFWTLLCQNPNAEARNNLLWFLETHGFKILQSGLFTSYRNVVSKDSLGLSDDELNYLNDEFVKIKRWKKSPRNFSVVRIDVDGELLVTQNSKVESDEMDVIGNLFDLINTETISEFTDNYSKKMQIRLGVPVRMDRSECDENSSNECSRGLHLSHKDWDNLNFFGSTTIRCLCNPMNVVAVPTRDSYNKIRTCEYFPVEIVERDMNGKIIETVNDGDELNYFTVSYDGVINNNESSTFQLQIPERPDINFERIVENLDMIKANIKNRVL